MRSRSRTCDAASIGAPPQEDLESQDDDQHRPEGLEELSEPDQMELVQEQECADPDENSAPKRRFLVRDAGILLGLRRAHASSIDPTGLLDGIEDLREPEKRSERSADVVLFGQVAGAHEQDPNDQCLEILAQ